MKFVHTALILVITIGFLGGCSMGSKASQQQKKADRLADEYLDCIGSLIKKTAREKYADHITRRNVILDSCQSSITPFTIVQEEAFSNVCVNSSKNSGKSNQTCDNEAVAQAKLETKKLEQEARRRIDTSPRVYY
ncbi:MAG: hypothetical protein R3E63_08500 [Pseudomonadales bacterium]